MTLHYFTIRLKSDSSSRSRRIFAHCRRQPTRPGLSHLVGRCNIVVGPKGGATLRVWRSHATEVVISPQLGAPAQDVFQPYLPSARVARPNDHLLLHIVRPASPAVDPLSSLSTGDRMLPHPLLFPPVSKSAGHSAKERTIPSVRQEINNNLQGWSCISALVSCRPLPPLP